MQRYIVVDADGYAVNVVLWDGETPLTLPDGHRLLAEENCDASERPPDDANDGAVSAAN